jgi:hypothetical protein
VPCLPPVIEPAEIHRTFNPRSVFKFIAVKSGLIFCSVPPQKNTHTWKKSLFAIQKPAPSPCAYCIGRPRPPPGSSLGFHLRSNSRWLTRFIHPPFVPLFGFSPLATHNSSSPFRRAAWLPFVISFILVKRRIIYIWHINYVPLVCER